MGKNDDVGGGNPGANITEFYEIVRESYAKEELREFIQRTDLAVRVAKIRGLIPWDYDGEREDIQKRTMFGEVKDIDFDFPPPPQWGWGFGT